MNLIITLINFITIFKRSYYILKWRYGSILANNLRINKLDRFLINNIFSEHSMLQTNFSTQENTLIKPWAF